MIKIAEQEQVQILLNLKKEINKFILEDYEKSN